MCWRIFPAERGLTSMGTLAHVGHWVTVHTFKEMNAAILPSPAGTKGASQSGLVERRSPRTLASPVSLCIPCCSEGCLRTHSAARCSEKACWACCWALQQHPWCYGEVSPQKCGPLGTQDGHREGFKYSKFLAHQGPGSLLRLGVVMSPGIMCLITLGGPALHAGGVCEGRDQVPLVHLRPGILSSVPSVNACAVTE